MVANKIMPKIWTVAGMMLKSPQTALYWSSYLMKVCADTKSLCMQFESVVTNSSLIFADIQFLEINQEIATILKLSEIGDVDWQQLLIPLKHYFLYILALLKYFSASLCHALARAMWSFAAVSSPFALALAALS